MLLKLIAVPLEEMVCDLPANLVGTARPFVSNSRKLMTTVTYLRQKILFLGRIILYATFYKNAFPMRKQPQVNLSLSIHYLFSLQEYRMKALPCGFISEMTRRSKYIISNSSCYGLFMINSDFFKVHNVTGLKFSCNLLINSY